MISVPTIPPLSRVRRYLDKERRGDVSPVITGGLRLPADFIKATALGACGHDHLNQFRIDDLTTRGRDTAHLSGVAYGGISED